MSLLRDFIDSLNNGLKTYVGEDGVKNLSEAMGINNEDNALVSLSGGIVGSGSVESLENINPITFLFINY